MGKQKLCKNCGSEYHYSFQCRRKDVKPRLLKKGKIGKQWDLTRAKWLRDHTDEWFECFYCHKQVPRRSITIDHRLSRSRHPELRYKVDNLVACCYACNADKGSLDDTEYIEKLRLRGL